MNLLKTV